MLKRALAIDYGDRRTGIAVSDMLGITAQPVETIFHDNDDSKVVERVAELVKQYEIDRIVYGFPLNMNGTQGPRVEKTLKFIEQLKKQLDETGFCDIVYVKKDERLTSVVANRTMHELGIKTKKKKKIVDQLAAVQILQDYLDSGG